MQDIKYWIWLSMLDLNPKNLKKCLEKFTPIEIWYLKNNVKDYFTKEEVNKIENKNYRINLEKYELFLKKYGIKLLIINEEDYPIGLKNIENPPIVLYTLGNINLLKEKNIAIVGARNCTQYGETVAKAFAYLLSKNNIVITSGLARGIDEAAHKGTIIAKGGTIAVIGTGIDIIYPKENETLFKKIVENNGLIISEYPLGTKPNKENFPRRNRIISGIADGVLVVEAGEKSGALITVDFALEQGKNIYATPREYFKPFF